MTAVAAITKGSQFKHLFNCWGSLRSPPDQRIDPESVLHSRSARRSYVTVSSSCCRSIVVRAFLFGVTTPELCLTCCRIKRLRTRPAHDRSVCLSAYKGIFRNACSICLVTLSLSFTSPLLGSESENWHHPPVPVCPWSPYARRSSLTLLLATPLTTRNQTFVYRAWFCL